MTKEDAEKIVKSIASRVWGSESEKERVTAVLAFLAQKSYATKEQIKEKFSLPETNI